jgi:hypothetical protein
MEIVDQQSDCAVVRLSADEIIALTNALNESLELIEEWEFETRMGVTKLEARSLLAALNQVQTS